MTANKPDGKVRPIPRLIIVCLLVVVLLSIFLIREVEPSGVEVSEDMLEPGDIIFVDLYTGWSHGGYWDHLAIYVGSQPTMSGFSDPAVVEATFNRGIIRTRLARFLSRDEPATMSVRRLKEMPFRQESVQKAIEYALAQVGKPFDFTAHATALPHKINEERLHCTEVIWRAYKAAGIDIDCNDGIAVYPEDIYYSPKLRPVEP